MRVAVNVRPLIGTERASGCAPVLECRAPAAGSSGDATIEANGRTFPYDFVYAPGTAEERLYDECVAPLVEGLFKGYNATVLAYGQTGSGKSAYHRAADDASRGCGSDGRGLARGC